MPIDRWPRLGGAAAAMGMLFALGAAAPALGAQPDAAARAMVEERAPTTEVTLLTGDTVAVQRLANGSYLATPHAVARADRSPVTFQTLRTPDGDLYVIPSDAQAGLALGRLDLELFNVRRLAEEYAGTPELPVIVKYARGVAPTPKASALPGRAKSVRALESLNAAGVSLANAKLRMVWGQIRSAASSKAGVARGPGAGLEKVWLDGKVQASLDQSVPQIGAPEAWQAGLDGTGVSVAILDTGVDASHPDLIGKVAQAQNFTTEPSAADGHGHGTHVASTVAGTGEASGGTYRGVAPGAQLLIGKVLDDHGDGLDSWVIDGMEWAAHSGARVVSMSLGGGASDGTDPMSQAVDRLTADTGTLFVIAAGNDGPGPHTVATPGSAASALTVGAVDKADNIASFSSRGPLVRSYALKPDITAPGVRIAAAAANTGGYVPMSGTSMATPHVSGAVAILAQRHPDWRAPQLKAALTASAKAHSDLTVYQQGAGRLDVAKAVGQQLTTNPTIVDFGPVEPSKPITRTVTLANHGQDPVTVSLDAMLRGPQGQTSADQIAVSPAAATISGAATVDVTITFTPSTSDFGAYSGVLRAMDGDGTEVLRAAIGAYQRPPGHTLTITSIPPDGWPTGRMIDWSTVVLVRVDAPQDPLFYGRDVTVEAYVPDGVYLVSVSYAHVDPMTGDFSQTQLIDPEVVVRGADRDLVLDGKTAGRVRVITPKAAEPRSVYQTFVRGTAYGGSYAITYGVESSFPGRQTLRVTPTRPVTVGTATVLTGFRADEPTAQVRVLGAGAPTLEASYPDYYFQEPKLDGTRAAHLVDVGTGTAAKVKAAKLRGNVALIQLPWHKVDWFNHPASPAQAVLRRLRDAGAIAAIVAADEGWVGWCGPELAPGGDANCEQTAPLPVLRIGPGEAERLREYAKGNAVPAEIISRPTSSYGYQLHFTGDAVPAEPTYRALADQLTTITSDYHADAPTDLYANTWSIASDGSGVFSGGWQRGQAARTEYVGPVSDRVLWWRSIGGFDQAKRNDPTPTFTDWTYEVYPDTKRRRDSWGGPSGLGAARPTALGVLADAVPLYDGCLFCRDANQLWLLPSQTYAGGLHYGESYMWAALMGRVEAHLFRNGEEIPAVLPVSWDLSAYPEPARYRLTHRLAPTWAANPTQISTAWEFTSQAATGDEAQPGYECFGQGGDSGPPPEQRLCRVERALHIGWDLAPAVTLENVGRAPGSATIGVSVYTPVGAPAPQVEDLRVEVSYDSGASWQSAVVTRMGQGEYRVVYTIPPLSGTDGTVSVRARASDEDGNRVEQTLLDAYLVTRAS